MAISSSRSMGVPVHLFTNSGLRRRVLSTKASIVARRSCPAFCSVGIDRGKQFYSGTADQSPPNATALYPASLQDDGLRAESGLRQPERFLNVFSLKPLDLQLTIPVDSTATPGEISPYESTVIVGITLSANSRAAGRTRGAHSSSG